MPPRIADLISSRYYTTTRSATESIKFQYPASTPKWRPQSSKTYKSTSPNPALHHYPKPSLLQLKLKLSPQNEIHISSKLTFPSHPHISIMDASSYWMISSQYLVRYATRTARRCRPTRHAARGVPSNVSSGGEHGEGVDVYLEKNPLFATLTGEKGKGILKPEMDEKSYSYADISSLSSPNNKDQEDDDIWCYQMKIGHFRRHETRSKEEFFLIE